jgi:hypothetical protein
VDRVAGTGDRRHVEPHCGPILSVSRVTLREWLILTPHQHQTLIPTLVLAWALT